MDLDKERNRLTARAVRYGRVGANVGGVAARIASARLLGLDPDRDREAAALATALGGLKGPIMKVAQLLATIPEALPAEYAAELGQLQSQAPPMGWPFVRRRMAAELGPDWESRFASFEREAAASASLGQVHRARAHDGRSLAAKLQYPDMQSAVEADLMQLAVLFSIHRRMRPAIETSEMREEIAARLREELDYDLEARHMRLYGLIFAGDPLIRVPKVLAELSAQRLLTMTWLEGRRLLDYTDRPLGERNQVARAMFRAWWYPFSHYGVIHGDPHLGNYTVAASGEGGKRGVDGVNLFDYGCVRVFPPRFVHGVVELYRALKANDKARIAHAFEMWGFAKLTPGTTEAMTIWARFMCGPILDDRVRTAADGVRPSEYGRREIGQVMRALRAEGGGLPVPREFVFLERATIGLGSAFLRLGARLNFHRMYEDSIANFDEEAVARRQAGALEAVGLAE
jgi:predicted unusual protein kinase regulating ubiquinone biosynthesis (AarF/ABC1/UbiB family)